MNLNECAKKTGTDKGPDFHGYTNYYDYWFSKYINPDILEIGVLDGASIEMYNQFYNGECDIYCIDIEDKKHIMDKYTNVHFYQLDQGNASQWDSFLEKTKDIEFDIILDDGSHQCRHQILTLSKLHKRVKEDGIYVLEDLHANFCPDMNDFCTAPLTFLSYLTLSSTPYLSEQEQKELTHDIKDIVTLNLESHGTFNQFYNNRSISSVITFKK